MNEGLFPRLAVTVACWCALVLCASAQQLPQEAEIASYMKVEPGQRRPALIYDPILAQVARARAADMAARNYFSHVNPDGIGPNYLVQQAGYVLPDWWGKALTSNYIESIAAGQTTSAATWSSWMGSSGHRTHLLATDAFYADQTRYGVGYFYSATSTYKHYWVVLTAPPSLSQPAAPAKMASPVQGSTLESGAATFTWNAGSGISQYWLHGGSAQGGADLFTTDAGSALSLTVGNLPQDGGKIWLRLWSLIGDQWLSTDSWVTAAAGKNVVLPAMVSPAPGTALGTQATFTWSAGDGVSTYHLQVGTTAGGADLFDASTGTARTATVTGLPVDGRSIYVRLRWLANRGGSSADYTYSSIDGRAVLTSPADGATLPASTTTFSWSGGTGVTQYWLSGGSTKGSADLFTVTGGAGRTLTLSGLPADGEKIWLRLWSLIGGQWRWIDSSVTAATELNPAVTSPAPGSQLADVATFQWHGGRGAVSYHLHVGSKLGGADLYNASTGTGLSATATNLPADGRPVYVRLWWLSGGKWYFADTSYVSADGRVMLTSPTPGATLESAAATFSWSGGTGVSQYWLYLGSTQGGSDILTADAKSALSLTAPRLPDDGRTIWVRIWSLIRGQWIYSDASITAPFRSPPEMVTPTPGSTLTGSEINFQWRSHQSVSLYHLQAGTSLGGADLFDASAGQAGNQTIYNLPTDGRPVFVRLWWFRWGKWSSADYTYQSLDMRAAITSPVENATLPGLPATFTWSAGQGVAEYYLYIGSSPGGADIHAASHGLARTVTLKAVPADGRRLHLRLWSRMGSVWTCRDSSCLAPASP